MITVVGNKKNWSEPHVLSFEKTKLGLLCACDASVGVEHINQCSVKIFIDGKIFSDGSVFDTEWVKKQDAYKSLPWR